MGKRGPKPGALLERSRQPYAKLLDRLHADPKVTVRAVMAELFPKLTVTQRQNKVRDWRQKNPGFDASYSEAMDLRRRDFSDRCERAIENMREGKPYQEAMELAGVKMGSFWNRLQRDPELQRRYDALRLEKDVRYLDQVDHFVLKTTKEIEAAGDDFRRGNTVLNATRTRAAAAARIGRPTPLIDMVDARVDVYDHSSNRETTRQLLTTLNAVLERALPPKVEHPERERFEVIEIDPRTGEWVGPPKELTA